MVGRWRDTCGYRTKFGRQMGGNKQRMRKVEEEEKYMQGTSPSYGLESWESTDNNEEERDALGRMLGDEGKASSSAYSTVTSFHANITTVRLPYPPAWYLLNRSIVSLLGEVTKWQGKRQWRIVLRNRQ